MTDLVPDYPSRGCCRQRCSTVLATKPCTSLMASDRHSWNTSRGPTQQDPRGADAGHVARYDMVVGSRAFLAVLDMCCNTVMDTFYIYCVLSFQFSVFGCRKDKL